MDADSRWLDTPLFGCKLDEQLSRSGAALAHRRNCSRRAAAAGRHAIVRHEPGVSHDELKRADGDTQFFGCGLAKFRACALAGFDFASHHGDRTVGAQMYSSRNILRGRSAKAPATSTAPLRERSRNTGRNQQACP